MMKDSKYEAPKSSVKEPLVHIVKRSDIEPWKAWGIRIAAVLLGMLVSALFINGITNLNPAAVFKSMFAGAFGTDKRIWQTLKDMSLLLCIGIGLALTKMIVERQSGTIRASNREAPATGAVFTVRFYNSKR